MTLDALITQAHRQAWPRRRLAAAVVQLERERVLKILTAVPRAALDDGRDLVVRTDAIRKVHGADAEGVNT